MNTKMKMRMLSLLLSFVMLVGLMPTTVWATSAGAEESYALSITNKPGTTFVLSQGEYTSDVCDLWKEIDSDGTGELKFDQSFSININDAVEVYNNYIDTQYPDGDREHYKALEDNNNGAIFYVQARVLINDYKYQFSSKASYEYAPYGLDGEYNEGCGEWDISSYYDDLSDFFTMSKDGGVLNLSLDGTVKEIYEALKEQDETLGDVTINNLEFELRVSCEVEYRGSYGSTNYTELSFEAISHSLYDKHIFESASEYDNLSVIPITAPLTVNVAPAYEGCYEPVKTEYNWYYEFIKEGYDTDEDSTWYGYFEKDESKESDVLTETAPSGTVYGLAYGTVDSGKNNSIMLSDILNEDNKAFINSFIGEKPRELGGKGQMSIVCAVTLTFEDGKQWVVYITKADYMSRLIIPCMHACTVCGLCTVTDEMLPCNFDQMSYDISNVCICDEPSVPEFEVTLESEKQLTIESTDTTVKVVVEKIEVEETPTHSFIINTTEAVGVHNVIGLYNINVFDEEGYPYTLNRYYDEGEELTVSVPVSMEEALALQSGEAALYHILADGTAEEVEGVTVAIDGESATMTFTSDSFSPFILARSHAFHYYGRAALSALTNSTALLYAYDQLAAGVETSAETITVYNGTNAITQAELEMVMDAYRRDYAHHFWLGNSYHVSSNATSVVSIKPTYTMTGTDLETAKTAFEQKVTDILSGITSSMSEYEKELYLHDKLAETVAYEEGTNAHNAYGALVDGKAVCEGYAEALQYLLQRVGIQSFLAVGTSINPATNTAENHEWNYVKIDGEYYHVDLTWDDQGENLFHAYFNQSDTVIQEDHTISTTGYALPVCDSTIAQYFTGKDEYLDIYTADTVGQLLKDNDLKVHVYIPETVNDFISWYETNIADIGTKAGITGGFSYGYAKLGRELILNVLPASVTTYTVTVTGGTASPAGPNAEGTEVTVTADPDPEGKKFKEWQIEGLSTTTSESRSIFFYMPANNVTITATYEDANIIIESANATITEPVVGANPDFNIVSADESKYTVTVVKWNLLDGSSYPVLTADDKFERGESYQLDVKFVANPGYEFSDSCVYNVNGVPSAAYSLTKGERRCYFDVYEIIDTINVKGVVAPVAGATPDVSGITSDTDGINVIDVKWRDKDGYAFEGNPFVAGEKYILWLKYETESDYKVADDAEVTFNISDSNILDKEITHPIIKMTYEVPADTTYTVSFDANSGTGTMTPVTGISGEYELPACTFTAPSGKQFKAWSVGGSEKAVGDKITVTADTTVTAVWETVSEYTKKGDISAVEATATIDPALGATTNAVSFTITEPADAAAKGVIFAGTSWYKKDASSIYGWTQCSNGVDTFEEGTYRLSVQLRSKSNDDKEYYAMSDATTFTVNGVQWNSEEPFRDNYATSGYGYRFFVSPEFTLGGKTLDSIAITTPPTKTDYREGEDFNPAGMVVTATYTDSTTAPVVLYTVTDGSALTAGKTSVTISYTEGGVTETTTQAITVAKEYTVTVNGGTGNGKKIAGEEVTISAFVSTGMQFKEWQGTDGLTFTSGDKNSQTATFTMPAHDVTVTAVTGPAEYYVSVTGGGGTGTYETGATVTIVADAPEAGKQFKTWVVGDGKVLNFTESTITDSTAKFIMPGEAVRIYAEYEDIPAAKTPIDTVNISDLAKPVVGEMPNNSITVNGTGVTVDDDGSYWGRFVSPSFSPVYDDDTAVDSVVFREGETYMFQLYLNAAAGYEFTADSKFYFASDLLPAPDMTDLSKSFAMVNPSDSTQAVIYINMNDIAHIHVPGDWDFNDTHHWRKCTASGCDAGADVSRLPDYAEHSFVNGLCTCGAHKHNWSADWSVNETHHWHECSANGCSITDNSGKDGYAAHDFTTGACVCGVENVITSIEISGITAPVAGATPVNSASVDKVGAEVDEENTFWVRYDASTGRTSDTYADGTSVYNTPFRDREIYLLQITIKPKTGYSFTADTKLLYGGTALSAPDAANPTASCGAIAPDCSMAMALINPTGASAPLTYTVSFVANGGTGTMADVTVESGAEYTLPANGFTAPAGKQFKSWSVGGAEKAVGDKITVTADTTVTAVWEDIPVTYYTVTFNSNGGSAVAEQTVAAGQKAVKPADPVKNGYIFKGWKLDGSTYDFNTAVNKNITLVAVWEEDNSFMNDWYWALIMLHSQKFDITATASAGGEIAPEGVTKVQYSKNITYTITPDAGYAIKAVFVDGKDVGAVSAYTFKNVTKKHTIHALFEQINPYTDVKAGDWFYDDILYVTAMGLMEGTGNGKFSPEITTDRAMLVTVLWRLEGCPVVDSPVDFFDVADGLWYSAAIDWASAYGIVNGYGDGRFGPTDQITREQIMAILNRYAAYKGWTDGTALPMLAQYKCSEWAESNVIWAENNGLLDGLGVDVSDMTAKASRAELAAYLHKFMKNIVE